MYTWASARIFSLRAIWLTPQDFDEPKKAIFNKKIRSVLMKGLKKNDHNCNIIASDKPRRNLHWFRQPEVDIFDTDGSDLTARPCVYDRIIKDGGFRKQSVVFFNISTIKTHILLSKHKMCDLPKHVGKRSSRNVFPSGIPRYV